MVVAVALILTVACFIAIAAPFFRNANNGSRELWDYDDTSAASGSRATMLKQLETDYRTGILSEADYRAQRASLYNQVESAVEEVAGVSTLDEEIEKKVAGLRRGTAAHSSDEIDELEEKVRQLRRPTKAAAGRVRQAEVRFCPQCGAGIQPGSRFCTQCGEKLS